MSHLVIVDGHAILHRAYHSIPPLTVDGQPVNAIYGFFSMLLTAIDQLKPKYLVICLDSPGPNFRNQEFIGYRAKRKPADHELIKQLGLLPKALEKSGLAHFSLGGYEADDLIATVTTQALQKKSKKTGKKIVSKVTIITGDKDIMQLVSPKVSLFVPIRGLSEIKLYTPSEVKEKLGVTPAQVIDLKALMGDMSDNYPGVSGIGPKVACDLLNKYQNLENIYQNLEEIKPAIREKLIKDRDNAYLSQKLATLVLDTPIKYRLLPSRWQTQDQSNLILVFNDFHFKSLVSRLTKKNKSLLKVTPQNGQTSLF